MSEGTDKLTQSRLAIIEHIQRKDRRHGSHEFPRNAGSHARQSDDGQSGAGNGWFDTLKSAATDWWRKHPAHMAVELATPVLSSYARRKPVQFLAIAAGVGALALFARPWKLISVTGLLVALAKSTQVSTLLMSAMSAADYQKDSRPST